MARAPRFPSAALAALALLLAPAAALAADWHVAPGGDDGAAGTEGAPLATPARAVARSSAGDRLLLRRDGTYRVSNLALGAGRSLLAYGTGADPVLTASQPVRFTGTWDQNAAVRTAAVAQRVLAVYVDGRFVRLARYPNEGFLRVDNDDSPDAIVDAELAARPGVLPGRWTGAQVRWRRWSWWWETRPISAHGPVSTLTLGPEGRFQDDFSDPGSAYFIDDSLAELDAPGEWFWGGGTLYLYPPAWATPATMTVEVVTTEESGVHTAGTSLTGVKLARFAGTALELDGPATVDGCTFEQLEADAVHFNYSSQPFAIRRSVFRDVRNVAVLGWANGAGAAGSVIEQNLFQRIGMERGYGGSGSWHAAGVILGTGNALTFRDNRLVDTGYAGVILGADGHTVEHNVLVRTMGTLNDGAAVYTNCNRSTIRENVILDTIGDLETSHPWTPLGHGIWPEFLSDFRESVIEGNVIFGSNGHGIMLPNNFACSVKDNLAVDDRLGGLGLSGTAGDDQGNAIAGNVLAAVAPTRRLSRPESLASWGRPGDPVALQYQPGLDYGLMAGTTFIAAPTGAAPIRPEGGADLASVAAWKAAAPTWASDVDSRMVRAHAILLFNDTAAHAAVAVPAGTWTRPDGTAVGATVPLAPFHGAVLVTTGAAPPASPPYLAASGIDWRASDPFAAGETPIPDPSPDPGGGGGGGSGGGGGASTGGARGACGTPGSATALALLALPALLRLRRRR